MTLARGMLVRLGWMALVVALLLGGCSPKAGTACSSEGKKACGGKDTLLVCEHGTFAAFPCKGQGGCSAVNEGASCDFSANAQGDACPSADNGRKECKPDGKTQLRCESGHLNEVACVGVGACKTDDHGSSQCDRGEPELGLSCSSGSLASCNVKGDSIYGCVGGKWAVARACRGPNGCKRTELAGTYCDLGVVGDGDACEDGERGRFTCGPAREAVYECKEGRFQLSRKCAAGKTCKYVDVQIEGDTNKGPLVLLPKGADCQ